MDSWVFLRSRFVGSGQFHGVDFQRLFRVVEIMITEEGLKARIAQLEREMQTRAQIIAQDREKLDRDQQIFDMRRGALEEAKMLLSAKEPTGEPGKE